MRGVGRALVLVDVINDFRHEDGEKLLTSFRERHGGFLRALERAHAEDVPVVYANDNKGIWDGDAPGLVRRAIEDGLGGGLIEAIAPRPGDRFVLKPRYSGFDSTPLELLLRSLDIDHILLSGTATELCVTITATQAQQLGFQVTVLADACATIDARNEAISLDYLEQVLGVEVSGRA
jgi:nicotinamidase-related amidase